MNGIIIGAICFVVGSWFGFGICAVFRISSKSQNSTVLTATEEE